jgi:hypothetical protein
MSERVDRNKEAISEDDMTINKVCEVGDGPTLWWVAPGSC